MKEPRARASKLAGFDGLRAVAAMTVLSYHVVRSVNFSSLGSVAPVLWELKGGVGVFFVISGTLLYLPYARAIRDGRGLPDWRRYARRRVVRIVPAYWLVLIIAGLGPFSIVVFGPDAWRFFGFAQVYQPSPGSDGLPVAWSLCVEVSFYALLPVLARFAARQARRAGPDGAVRMQLSMIAAAGLISVAIRARAAGSLTGPIPGPFVMMAGTLPGLLDWFAIGMALAVIAAELEAGRGERWIIAKLGRRPWLCLTTAVAAFLIGVPAQQADLYLPSYGLVTHLAIGVGSGVLVLAVIVPQRGASVAAPLRVLRSAPLLWLGTISYGIYLWHVPMLRLVANGIQSASLPGVIGLWSAVAALAVVSGAASWYLVERPAQRWLRGREARARAGAEAEAGVPVALDSAGVTL